MLIGAALATVVGLVAFSMRDRIQENVTSTERTTTSSTTPPPTDTSTIATWSGPRFEDLPDNGFAVVDGERATLYGFDGTRVGAIDDGAETIFAASGRANFVLRHDNTVGAFDPYRAESPSGCDGATGDGGIRVALCGGEEGNRVRLEQVFPDGSTRTVADRTPSSYEPEEAHYRWALPDPAGAWTLAQWRQSFNGCEAPAALVSRVSPEQETTLTSSTGLGWAPDGRPVVFIQPELCGNPASASEPSGVYLVDLDSLDREQVTEVDDSAAGVVSWSREAGGTNAADRILSRALEQLEERDVLECCSEYSPASASAVHGGTSWVLHDERYAEWGGTVPPGLDGDGPELWEMTIDAVPSDGGYTLFSEYDVTAAQPSEVDGHPVVAGSTDDERTFVAFRCGGYDWGLRGIPLDDPIDPGGERALASALIPYLYCTVDDQLPTLGGGG